MTERAAQNSSPKHEPIAIIGMGCLFPKADSVEAYWANIREGVDAITPIPATHWRPQDYFDADPQKPDMTYAQRGGFIDPYPFDPLAFGISPNNLEATDTTQLLGLVVAQQALRDAGYDPMTPGTPAGRQFDRDRVSVVLGVTGTLELVIPLGARLGHPLWRKALKEAGVDDATANDAMQRIADGYVPWQENSFPGLLGNVAAGRIANRLDLGGTNCVVDAACASSLSAIHLACLELESGRCDMVVTGGLDTFNDIFMYMCFSKTPALSPTGNSRPFSAVADGTILGEGLGVIVAKRLTDAERDGDRIYAVLRGMGSSSDGKGNAIYAPSAAGQSKCLKSAYDVANVSPDTIELVEAHGTGTKVGDATEIKALTQVYGEAKAAGPWCAVGSVKSQIGHTKAAAGAAGVIKAALALHHKVLPPTIKVERPADALTAGGPLYVNTVKRPWLPRKDHPRRAAVSAFGFGGSNFHCVLEEYSDAAASVDWDGEVQIIALSGDDRRALDETLAVLDVSSWPMLRAAARQSRQNFSADHRCRLALVIEHGKSDPAKLIAVARERLAKQGEQPWTTPDGLYYGVGPAEGTVAVIFPGQGSQYVGMLRDLACQFPAVLDTLAQANDVAERFDREPMAERLSDRIYPVPVFTADQQEAREQALRDTRAAQPALGAVSLGAWRVLQSFGIEPAAFAGHSYGELVALCAAGWVTPESLHELSAVRGRLMAEGEGDRGSMLAAAMSLEALERFIADEKLDLVIANRNAPQQAVLSGSSDHIDRAAAALKQQGVRCAKLAVVAAFHSRFVAAAEKPFAAAIAGKIAPAAPAVYANTTGERYPADRAAAAALLAGQLARPVEFVRQIRNMHDAGVRAFIEVGPGAKLTGLIAAILADREHHAIALDSSTSKRSNLADLARVLAQLAAFGHRPALDRWDESFTPPAVKKSAMTVPICGANYVSPRPPRPPRAVPTPTSTEPSPPPAPGSYPTSGISPVTASHMEPPIVNHALRATQENLLALQKMQEQTAQLHRQFLDNQQAAQRSIAQLIEQQQRLFFPPGSAPAPGSAPGTAAGGLAQPPQPPSIPDPPGNTSAPATSELFTTALLDTVAEKTGYPAEMLELDMQLEADLGIDSIKRVEILSALQEKLPEAPSVKPEDLGRLHSLRQIIDFMSAASAASGLAQSPQPPSIPDPPSKVSAPVPSELFATALLDTVAEKTGYPAEMLELNMQLEADLGIDSIKRVEILSALQEKLPEAPSVKPEDLGRLHTLRQIVEFMTQAAGGLATPCVAPSVAEPLPASTTVPTTVNLLRLIPTPTPLPEGREPLPLADGEWFITDDGSPLSAAIVSVLIANGRRARCVGIDVSAPEALAGVIILAPATGAGDDFLEHAFALVQRCGAALQRNRGLLATVTRLGGTFGFSGKVDDPTSGGLAGIVKTASHEWPGIQCKAIDLAAGTPPSVIADELLRGGPIEVGIAASGSHGITLNAAAIHHGDQLPLRPREVVIVTGGARGVTAEAAVALARACQPVFVLLGRSNPPADEPAWLALLREEAAIKAALLQHAPAGEKLTPRQIDEQYQRIVSARQMRNTFARLRDAGSEVIYRAIDVRNAVAVVQTIEEIRREHGSIRGLIHGAGVLADRLIRDKTREQFQRVYATKVVGLRNLLAALAEDDLRAIVLFSSSTARFGRKGQVDYAAANEVLNKLAQQQARLRPTCRVVSVNWGPWDGGMVTPSLRKVFEAEGVGVIPLESGAAYLLREISLPPAGAPVEVVILGPGSTAPGAQHEPLAVSSKSKLHTALEIELDVEHFPFLRSHVIDGKAVLPVAMIVEWLAHGAMHDNPGYLFHGFNDLRVLKGVILSDEQPLKLRVTAGAAILGNGLHLVPVELHSDGRLGHRLHARATIVLAEELPVGKSRLAEVALMPHPDAETIYDGRRLFHGPQFQAITGVTGVGEQAITVGYKAAPAPQNWIAKPLRSAWLADPLAIDSAFQAMILWVHYHRGAGSLPTFAGSYRQFRRSLPKDGGRIVVRVTGQAEHAAHADIEWLDDTGQLLARLEDYECVIDRSLNHAFARTTLEEQFVS